MTVLAYDPDQFTLVAAGVPVSSLGGFAEDSMIEFEQMGDDFLEVVGVDGQVTRSKNLDLRGQVTIHLMQSSAANTALSAVVTLARQLKNGKDIAPTLIKDGSGSTVVSMTQSWIAKRPKMDFGKTAKERLWIIKGVIDFRMDGNN